MLASRSYSGASLASLSSSRAQKSRVLSLAVLLTFFFILLTYFVYCCCFISQHSALSLANPSAPTFSIGDSIQSFRIQAKELLHPRRKVESVAAASSPAPVLTNLAAASVAAAAFTPAAAVPTAASALPSIVILTAPSASQFAALENLIGSVHHYSSEHETTVPVVVLDHHSNFTEAQYARMQLWQAVNRTALPTAQPLQQSIVDASLNLLKQYDTVLYIDAVYEIHAALATLQAYIKQYGYLLLSPNSSDVTVASLSSSVQAYAAGSTVASTLLQDMQQCYANRNPISAIAQPCSLRHTLQKYERNLSVEYTAVESTPESSIILKRKHVRSTGSAAVSRSGVARLMRGQSAESMHTQAVAEDVAATADDVLLLRHDVHPTSPLFPFRDETRTRVRLALVMPFISQQLRRIQQVFNTTFADHVAPCRAGEQYPADLVFYVATDYNAEMLSQIEAWIRDQPNVLRCFRRVRFMAARLSAAQNRYPDGINHQFYRTMDLVKTPVEDPNPAFSDYSFTLSECSFADKHLLAYDYSHMLWMEQDVAAIRPYWLYPAFVQIMKGAANDHSLEGAQSQVSLLQKLAAGDDVYVSFPWWVYGTLYRGSQLLGQFGQHINGNALYSLSTEHLEFIARLRAFFANAPPERYAFDIQPYFYLWGTTADRRYYDLVCNDVENGDITYDIYKWCPTWLQRRREQQRYWHKFVFTDYFQNCWESGCPVLDLTDTAVSSQRASVFYMRARYPHTYLIHAFGNEKSGRQVMQERDLEAWKQQQAQQQAAQAMVGERVHVQQPASPAQSAAQTSTATPTNNAPAAAVSTATSS